MRDCRRAHQVLLVEGEDDLHVVLQLWCSAARQSDGELERDPEFCIDQKGGIDNLLDSIVTEIQVDERRAVGIVVDADEDPVERWSEVAQRLRKVGIAIPKEPRRGGVCIEANLRQPRVGVWLMPDNQTTGELEDFVKTMLPEGDPVWPLSRQYIDGIAQEHRRFRPKKELRARVHAWLATRKRPGRMGAAIKEGDLEINGDLAVSFKEWLDRVFDESR